MASIFDCDNPMLFLLEYTIQYECGGNTTECAKRMGMADYNTLSRFRQHMKNGTNSTRVTEQLIQMYCKEGLSWDAAFRQYVHYHPRHQNDPLDFPCDGFFDSLAKAIEGCQKNIEGAMQLFENLMTLGIMIRKVICENHCCMQSGGRMLCPLMVYGQLVRELVTHCSYNSNSKE